MSNKTMTETLFPAIFFSLATLLFFPEVIWGGKVLLPAMGDAHLCEYSWGGFSAAMSKQGLFPLWNPLVLCGRPFGADIYSHLNLYLLACSWTGNVNFAWNLMIFVNVYLAGFFTFLYLKRLGIHPAGGMLAGILVAFSPSSGATWFSQVEAHIFYLPLVLWLTESFYAEKKTRYVVFLFLSTTLLFLNAVPQHSLYFGIFLILYIFFRFRSFLGIWVILFAAGASSFYLLRLLEYLSLSSREKMHMVMGLLPIHLLNFIFPYLYEAPFRPETNFFFSKFIGDISRRLFQTSNFAYYIPPYVGIFGLTFAWFSWRGRGPARFYWCALAFLLFFMMTYPVFARLYAGIPILSQLYRIDRLAGVFTFVMAVLAGIGFDRFAHQKNSLKGISVFYAIIAMGVVGVLGLARMIVSSYAEPIREMLATYIKKHIVGSLLYKAPLDFYLKRIDDFFQFILCWTDLLSPSVITPVVFIIFSLVVLFLWRSGRIGKRFFYVSCLLLLFIDLVTFYRLSTPNIGVKPGELVSDSGLIRYLEADAKIELFRVATVLEKTDYGVFRTRDILHPDLNMIYGLGSVEGYAPLLPKTYAAFVKNYQTDYDEDPDMILMGQEGSFDYALTDFLNVKYFMTKKGQKLRRTMPVVYEDASNVLFLNPTYYPRAFLIRDYAVSRDPEETLSILKERKKDLNQFAVLEEKPAMLAGGSGKVGGKDRVDIIKYAPDQVRVSVSAFRDGILILSDNFFPGWIAKVDGKVVKILKADFSFRGVPVPQGRHVIDFSYEPGSFRWGTILSILSIFFGASALIFGIIFRKVRF